VRTHDDVPAPDDAAPPSAASPHDSAWFEVIFRTHARAVFRYIARRAPLSEVEDLTADVLATAWRRRADVPEGAELPWLYRTAAYVLANHRRKARPVLMEEGWDGVDNDSDPADLALSDDQARRALQSLSARDRQILLLHAWDGLDGADLGAVLGISRSGAEAALSRARARLRTAWAAQL
jgi:RNA polymerase sigma factor (sigma-70 family)